MDDASTAGAYGVATPDLGSSGKIYSKDYLIAFINNPALGSKVSHKFTDGRVHPMPSYELMNTPQEIADMVAYLQSIAPKEMTNKEVFVDACQRCHGLKYADMQKEQWVHSHLMLILQNIWENFLQIYLNILLVEVLTI